MHDLSILNPLFDLLTLFPAPLPLRLSAEACGNLHPQGHPPDAARHRAGRLPRGPELHAARGLDDQGPRVGVPTEWIAG